MTQAMGIGLLVSVVGLSITYFQPLSPGATIVMLAIGLYAVASIVSLIRPVRKRHTDPHPDHDDDLHLTVA